MLTWYWCIVESLDCRCYLDMESIPSSIFGKPASSSFQSLSKELPVSFAYGNENQCLKYGEPNDLMHQMKKTVCVDTTPSQGKASTSGSHR